jgi:SAM-dependent methyltransferase
MAEMNLFDLPSPFVADWARSLVDMVGAPRRALDIAMGRGRNTLMLAAAGFRAFGVDVRLEALEDARRRARERGLAISAWCTDLTSCPLPRDRFELIVVSRYLQRDLFERLRDALVPGGAILYETFTEAQLALGRGPSSPDHLLQPGELRSYFEGFDILFYEEVVEPDALARLVARKPSASRPLLLPWTVTVDG